MLKLEASGVTIDTGATGDQALFSAKLLSGTLDLEALGGAIAVSARNLAVTADGDIASYDDPDTVETEKFIVEIFFGGTFRETMKDVDGNVTGTEEVEYEGEAARDVEFQWPAWLPLKLRYISLEWADIQAAPGDFILTVTAAISIDIPGLIIAGYVEGLKVDAGKLAAGEFPIVGLSAAGLYVEGSLFGLTVGGGFVLGTIDVDSNNEDVHAADYSGDGIVTDTLFYAGLQLKVQIANFGAQFAVGLAKIGDHIVPLEVMVGVSAPILIEPISGLTLGAFAGRVQFATELTDIADYTITANLKAIADDPGSAVTPDLSTWVAGLKSATLRIAQGDEDGSGPADVWELPMTITVSATFYSLYASPQALSGTVVVKFDTVGRILIAGELAFGDPDFEGPMKGTMSINAALYADLTNVADADFAFAFYASYGTPLPGLTIKPFEIAASLKVKILKEDGTTWRSGTDTTMEQATLSLELFGDVKFLAGGALVVHVVGTVDLQVALQGPTDVKLRFNAQVGISDPTPNPLGENFGEIAGYISIFEDATTGELELVGAVEILFKPETLKAYGIDIDAVVTLQINTTDADVENVTVVYFDAHEASFDIRANSFSLALQGHLSIGAPDSDVADAFITMDGFVLIEIDGDGLTMIFDVDLQLAPGGAPLLTLKATGFLRVNEDGIAARLDMTLDTDFPSDSGLVFTADFFLLINTTGKIVEIEVPEFITSDVGYTGPTGVVIPQAAPLIGGNLSIAEGDIELAAGVDGILGTADDVDLGDPAAVLAAGGTLSAAQDYYIISASGSLAAASLTFEGDFLLIITQEEITDPADAAGTILYTTVKLQVNAVLELPAIGSLEVHGFLDITNDGAAGLLSVELDLAGLEDDFGILITADIFLAFNTYDHEYEVPDAIAANFVTLAGGEHLVLEEGLIQIEIRGSLSVGSSLELSGSFYFKKTGSGANEKTVISVQATMSLPVLGTLTVRGDLILLSDNPSTAGVDESGVVGSLVVTLMSNAGLAAIDITYSATLSLKVNTTGIAQDDPGVPLTINAVGATLAADRTINFSGLSAVVGGIYRVTIAGQVFSYTATATDTLDSIVSGLAGVITSDAATSYVASGSGTILTITDGAGLAVVTAAPGIAAGTVILDLSGNLTVLGTFAFTGHFYFKKSGSDINIKFDATLTIGFLGTLKATGSFDSDTTGFQAQLTLKVNLAAGSTYGFKLSGTFFLAINTKSTAYTITDLPNLADQTVAAGGVSVFVTGDLELFSTFKLSGTFGLSISPATTSITLYATLSVFGVSLNVLGSASITTLDNSGTSGDERGIVLNLQLRLGTSTSVQLSPVSSVFSITGALYLKINTTGVANSGIAAHSVTIGGSVDANLLGFKLSGAIYITVSSAGLSIVIPQSQALTLDFFGFFTLQFYGSLNTDSSFSFTASASITFLDPDIFGFAGSVSVSFSKTASGVATLSGRVDATFGAFGIKLGAGGAFSFASDGVVSLSVYISLQITPAFSFDIWTPWETYTVYVPALVVGGTWSQTFGTRGAVPAPPPPPVLATQTGTNLYLNVGADAAARGSLYGPQEESYTVTLVDHDNNPATAKKLRVSGLGYTQDFDAAGINTIIIRDSQSYNTYLKVADDVGKLVEINLGKTVSGNNRFIVGTGVATVQGGSNKDWVEFGAAGGFFIGGPGSSKIKGPSNNNLVVTAPGFTRYLLTDTGLIYGSGANTYQMTFLSGSLPTVFAATGAAVSVLGADATSTRTINFTGIAAVAGATYKVTIAGEEFSYLATTGNTLADIVAALATAINNNVSVAYVANSATANTVTITNGAGVAAITATTPADNAIGQSSVGSSVRKVNLVGGTDATFETTSLPDPSTGYISRWTGTATFTGTGTASTLRSTTSADLILSNASLIESGVTIGLSNVTIALLYGDNDANTFYISDWSHNGVIDGRGGNDTVIAVNNADFTLTSTSLARSGLGSFTLTSVEIVNLTGGTGVNNFTVTGWGGTANLAGVGNNDAYVINFSGSTTGTINITDSSGTDSLVINGTTGADTITLAGGVITRTGAETVNFSGIESFTVNSAGGNDTITVSSTVLATTINAGAGDDTVTVNGNTDVLTINGDDDNDTINIVGSAGALALNGGNGNDTFNLRAFEADSTLDTGLGTNTVNVGAVVNSLNAINGKLTITAGGTSDTLNVYDTSDTTANTGQLTGSRLTGLGMASDNAAKGLDFTGFEYLVISLGSGGNTFTIINTPLAPTTVNSGTGSDRVNLRATSGLTTINLQGGADQLYAGSNAGVSDTNGNLNAISAAFTVTSSSGSAVVNLDDTGDAAVSNTTLTSTTLDAIFGSGVIMTYTGLTTLNLNLGNGNNTFTIASTHAAATNLVLGSGNDQIYIKTISGTTTVDSAGGNDTFRVGSLAPATSGSTLNAISAALTLTSGTGTNSLFLDDTADTVANTGVLTATTLTGLGMAAGITYTGFASLQLNLGSGNDTFTITSTAAAATTINAGAGDDTVTVNGNTNVLTINGDDDNDTINVVGSAGALALNGGNGNDTFNLRAFEADSTLDTGLGTNIVNVGAVVNSLNAINGKLTITAGGISDTLNVYDTSDSTANTGQLTGSRLTGLGMASNDAAKGLEFTGLEFLIISLGSGGNTFTIINTPLAPTTVNSGTGSDRVNLRGTTGLTTINLQDGADQLYAGSNAGISDTNGNLNAISAALTVTSTSGSAVVNLDDTGDAAVSNTTLTSTTLDAIFGSGVIMTYTGLTTLNLNLGNGNNTFTIASTHAAATNLVLGSGNDQIYIKTISGVTTVDSAGGNDTFRVGNLAPATSGSTLNAISAALTLTSGTGTNSLFLDDTADTVANTGVLTATTLTGLGMAAGITYTGFASLQLNLGSGNDTFTITSTHTGMVALDLGGGNDALTIVSIAGTTSVTGNTGDDTIWVNLAPTSTPTTAQNVSINPIGAVLTLDGGADTDNYLIGLSGQGSSTINVLDSGTAGLDNITLYGTPSGDTFLLRKDVVVLLQYAGGVQQSTFERINYDAAIDGTLTFNALAGVNYFAIDDNSAVTVINGGDEGDTFQVGQVFGSAFSSSILPIGDLIETTRGWLSHGVSYALTINGGNGDDLFSVFHNRAILNLNGGPGDDTFVVRAFALAGSAENAEHYDPLRGATNVSTGGGANHVAYALNAPITIDGGTGFNTLIIIATEFSDSIIVTEDGVYGAGLLISFTNIQELVIYGAEGNDNIWVLGTPVGASVRVVGGLGSDNIYLGGSPDPVQVADVNAQGQLTGTSHLQTFATVTDLTHFYGPLFVDGGIGDGVPPLVPGIGLPGEITGPLPTLGNPNLAVIEGDQVDRLTVYVTGTTGGQTGTLTTDPTDSTVGWLYGLHLAGATNIGGVAFLAGVRFENLEEIAVNLGSGDDTFTIESTTVRTIINGNDGNDTINVRSISGHTTINGGNGNDTINVGSIAPATGSVLTGIDALLAIDGGAGLDTVNVDHRGDTAGTTGWLTNTTLTGLEMTSTVAAVNDTISFRVNATSGTYTLSYGSATPEVLAWNATADDLTTALWRLLGNRNAFAQQLGNDFVINFQGALKGQNVNLGVNTAALGGTVLVAHRTDGINYYNVDTLNIDLGSAADVFNVQGTTAVTNLNTRGGEDRVYVSSLANLTTSTFTDFLLGNLDNILGTLNINAGIGRNLLMVSDESSSVANGSTGTPALFTNSLMRGFAPADITYQADAAAGSFAQGITLWTGAGADTINVTSTDNRASVRTTTTINTGAGNDAVTVSLSAATDGFFVVNTQDGDDTVDASASSLPVIIFGGAGSDTLTGGSGNDIIFGDNGRVQTLDGGGNVVAVSGGGGPGDLTDGITRSDYRIFTFAPSIGSADIITGNDGGDIILGGAAGDTVIGNEGDNVIIGDEGTVTVIANIVTSAFTTTSIYGGSDTITAGSGRDFILGGEAGDIINVGEGNNGVAGDHGLFTITSPIGFVFTSTDATVGGNDSITTGAGNDTIIGGTGTDTISAGAGRNVVFGDAGTITVVAGQPVSLATTFPDTGAGDFITTGTGVDYILGGDGGDSITAGNGQNVVFGDYGSIAWSGALLVTATATAQGTGGIDNITTGIDDDIIFGGTMGDVMHAGAGADVVFGDEGTINFTSGLATYLTNASATGDGDDQIFGEAGNDVLLGGGGNDVIDAAGDDNTVVGDHATILRAVNGTVLATTTVTSVDLGVGGNDTIITGTGYDLIIGGAGSDTIIAGTGTNVVLGDEGRIETIGFVLSLIVSDTGAYADNITTGADTDYILGGGANDTISAGDGTNVILGDHGTITITAGVLTQATSTSSNGGDDIITAGNGYNLVIGGFGTDTITVGNGTNVVFGDQGIVNVVGTTLVDATTFDSSLGANDAIVAGNGTNWIFGGTGTDTLTIGDGTNLVFGDQGRIDYVAATGATTATTLDANTGARDVIVAGNGTNWILGGDANDDITVGAGVAVVFGDHGRIQLTATGGTQTAVSLDVTSGGNDLITVGNGTNWVIGGTGTDTITVGDGTNLVFGDQGQISYVTATGATIATTQDANTGARDVIVAGNGTNWILGGDANDDITAGNGIAVVFGDHGRIELTATGGTQTAVSLDVTSGGNDVLIVGNGTNWVFGGAGADTLTIGDGTNLVFGDQGQISYLTATGATTVTTLSANTGARDVIVAGDGTNWILGGDANDDITAGNGSAVVFGDHGRIELSATGGMLTVTSLDFTSGGNDLITTGSGDDIILGGSGSDTINAGEGNNVVFGDHGQVIKDASGLALVTSLAPTQGAGDTITTGAGDDVIVGGAGNDVIHAGFGRNLILGDLGSFDFVANDLRTATSSDYTVGGDDTIDTGLGDDLIIGGFGADTITAGDGANVVLGDQGTVIIDGGVLIDVYTEQKLIGGVDHITTGAGVDVILGGAAGDVIDAGNGDNVLVGDHAELHWIAGILARMLSTDYLTGANDHILSGSGNDVILAGPGDDTVNAGEGDNIVFGDNGFIYWTTGVITLATTEDATAIGGVDDITTGAGNDLIFGGTAGDTIAAGNGNNVIFGDNGEAIYVGGIRSESNTFAPEDAGADTITSGTGDDTVLAGSGADHVSIAGGDNVVLGDEGEITYSGGILAEALSITPDMGAADTISTGGGNDLIIGGTGGDTINGGDGNNIVFGDNADAISVGGLPSFLQTLNPEFSGNDTISTGGGRDIILAGQGADSVTAGEGDDIILGDEGSVILSAGVVQSFTSESFADGSADTIYGNGGNDFIIGGNGSDIIDGGEGNNVIAGDNALFTMPGGVLVQVEMLAPAIGAADTITTGAGDDVIIAGAGGDTINGGNGNNVVVGDHATITFLGGSFATLTPTTPELGGDDSITTGSGADRIVGGTGADWINAGDGDNVVVGDHALIIQNNGELTLVESVAFADGGVDLIFTGTGNDLIIGGTAGDTIHAGAGNDLVFGDHAQVAGNIVLALLPLNTLVKPFTFTSIATQNLGTDGRSVASDDVIFGEAGDDILLGQQGNDIIFGGDGDDDLIGGHNVALGQDGADVLDGGAGYDVLAGDNASILRRGDNISPRAHVLAGTAIFDDHGNLLDLDTSQAWPTNVPERDTVVFDHAFTTDASLYGNDQLVGGAGDDVIFGELGDDQIHGDAAIEVTINAGGTVDRTAVRATATALFTTHFWVGADSDGDDYLEGNGGADLIFGGLGQDDIVGGSSALFGLVDSSMRPDGGDTIYGGNGTAAADESPDNTSLNGRSRDADVILGDNANIIRFVGLNGVNIGAFLSFQYNTTGTVKIVVRGFDLLDYSIPSAPSDIGSGDSIYGEDGDDTIHGEVGDDLMYGNGNDDNLYGGQGDDLIFGGAGDDSISHSDELRPPPPAAGAGGAAEGSGATGTAPGTIELVLPDIIQVILTGDGAGVIIFTPTPSVITSGGARNHGTILGGGTTLIGPGGGTSYINASSNWRIFGSSIMPSRSYDFAPNTPSFFNESLKDKDKDEDDDQVIDGAIGPVDGENQPLVPLPDDTALQDGQPSIPVTADGDNAPADTQPNEGENPPVKDGDTAGTPPAPATEDTTGTAASAQGDQSADDGQIPPASHSESPPPSATP